MIKLENLSFRYDQCDIFRNLSLQIPEQGITLIIGSNSSGKSTLAQLISGLIFPQQGQITVDNLPISSKTPAKTIRQKVGLVLQNPDSQILFPKVVDDLKFTLQNISAHNIDQKILSTLTKVGMQDFLNSDTHTLSGGQKQKIAIASQLVLEPSYLILDEATSMLDQDSKTQLYSLIKSLSSQTAIIMISNNLHELLLADHILVLDHPIQEHSTHIPQKTLQKTPQKPASNGRPSTVFSYEITDLLKNPNILTGHHLEIPFILQLAHRLNITTKASFSEKSILNKIKG